MKGMFLGLMCVWAAVAGAQAEGLGPPAEVAEPGYLAEVTQHLYRW